MAPLPSVVHSCRAIEERLYVGLYVGLYVARPVCGGDVHANSPNKRNKLPSGFGACPRITKRFDAVCHRAGGVSVFVWFFLWCVFWFQFLLGFL